MRRVVGVVAALLVLVMAMPAGAAPASQGKGKLSKFERQLIAEAQIEGKSTVTVLIATAPGANKQVVSGLEKLGATVQYRDDDVGYLRATVPVGKVDLAAALSGVEAIELDQVIPLENPVPAATGDELAVDPPGPGTPALNPYMPTQDIGAPQFRAANPTYDGRGVVIGIVDTGVDLLSPELETAKLLDGTVVPKIKDWVNGLGIDENDPAWLDMKDQVTASGGQINYSDQTYIAPADGQYRIALFPEKDSRLCGEYQIATPCLGGDINRDGDINDVFAVIWNTTTNMVWVDSDADGDFTDEQAMTDYRVNRDFGKFGTDNPATDVREEVAFVVQTDGKNKYVSIGILSGAHGTHVAGIAAGKGFFGGAFDGGAPEAQIVAVRACRFTSGCTAHALVEGMIWVAKQANVDVINMSIGGLPSLNDGNNTRAMIYDRLIEQYKVQMFLSAGNSGPGMNTVGDPSVASKAMSVGSYVTSDTWYANYGAEAVKSEALHAYSSRGPAEHGGFKPNIIAPGAAVSTVPVWQAGQPVGGTYPLPAGYGMFNGTSMAAPQAAGGAALLISAAKQAGVQYKPEQLRQAIGSSARYIETLGAHEQGHGLFQVGAAWELLQTNIKTVAISSKAPVNTALSAFLATPHYGPGIYEREGWAAGDSGTRTITFTRTSGGSKAITYDLIWVGNNGTFSSGTSISLPLNKPVDLAVNVAPTAAGVNSAVLYLDDPSTTGYDYQVMNTIVVAEQFTADNNFTVTVNGSADRPDMTTFFFNVPPNTPAFKLDTSVLTGRVRVLRYHPYGVGIEGSSTSGYYNAGAQFSRTYQNPTPGVWEVTVDTSRTSTTATSDFTLTASILGASVSPNPLMIDSAAIGTPVTESLSFTSLYGDFTGKAVGNALASAYAETKSIGNHVQQTWEVTVKPGSSRLTVTIGNPSDQGADLDLFIFQNGTEVGASADGDSEESVTINNPSGTYTVVVDGYSVPAGTTTYDYLDVYAHSAFGTVSVADVDAPHPYGSTWNADATITVNEAPSEGRFLQGYVLVRMGSVTIGSGEVRVMEVTQ